MVAFDSAHAPDPSQVLLRQVEPLLDVFDFERVRKAMVVLGWTYTGEAESPDLVRLRQAAKSVLQEVAADALDNQVVMSGGFRGWSLEGALFLAFEVASASAEHGKGKRL